jgi:hypothetical protein
MYDVSRITVRNQRAAQGVQQQTHIVASPYNNINIQQPTRVRTYDRVRQAAGEAVFGDRVAWNTPPGETVIRRPNPEEVQEAISAREIKENIAVINWVTLADKLYTIKEKRNKALLILELTDDKYKINWGDKKQWKVQKVCDILKWTILCSVKTILCSVRQPRKVLQVVSEVKEVCGLFAVVLNFLWVHKANVFFTIFGAAASRYYYQTASDIFLLGTIAGDTIKHETNLLLEQQPEDTTTGAPIIKLHK